MNLQKLLNVQSLLWLALALALAGSLKHLAATFASMDGNGFMGLIQAVAIDAGLFALAYSLRIRKAEKRPILQLWGGVTMFTLISIYGNLAYGLEAINGSLPYWIVATKPYVLAASLPILVLYLAELVSDNQQHMARVAERVARKVARESGNTDNLTLANEVRAAAKEEKLQQLASILTDKPDANNTELAKLLDVSRGTIRNYRQELNGVGK